MLNYECHEIDINGKKADQYIFADGISITELDVGMFALRSGDDLDAILISKQQIETIFCLTHPEIQCFPGDDRQ